MMINVPQYDNVIDNHEQVRDYILSDKFTWHYQAGNTNGTHPQQFEHYIYHPERGILNEYLYSVFEKLVNDIYEAENKQLKEICHMKVNCLLPPHKEHPLHRDDAHATNMISILYYPHTTTGATNIMPNGKVEPVENSCIVFNSTMLHSASSPYTDRRVTVNIVTEEKV